MFSKYALRKGDFYRWAYTTNFRDTQSNLSSIEYSQGQLKGFNTAYFNGYLFVRTLLNPECHLEILKTPGVVEILKSPSGSTPVSEEQIEMSVC